MEADRKVVTGCCGTAWLCLPVVHARFICCVDMQYVHMARCMRSGDIARSWCAAEFNAAPLALHHLLMSLRHDNLFIPHVVCLFAA